MTFFLQSTALLILDFCLVIALYDTCNALAVEECPDAVSGESLDGSVCRLC